GEAAPASNRFPPGGRAPWWPDFVRRLQKAGAGSNKRSRIGVRAILRESTLAGRHADQSYYDPQKHRSIEIHRADRAVAGIQENGQTRIGRAESRGCKTQAQPRGNPRDVSTARYARGDRHAPGAKRC